MKKMTVVAVVFAVAVMFSSPVYAESKPVEKLKSGLTDIVKSPLEIVDHVKAEVKDATFKPFGLIGGLLKGTFYMGKKMVGGVVDVVTFPMTK